MHQQVPVVQGAPPTWCDFPPAWCGVSLRSCLCSPITLPHRSEAPCSSGVGKVTTSKAPRPGPSLQTSRGVGSRQNVYVSGVPSSTVSKIHHWWKPQGRGGNCSVFFGFIFSILNSESFSMFSDQTTAGPELVVPPGLSCPALLVQNLGRGAGATVSHLPEDMRAVKSGQLKGWHYEGDVWLCVLTLLCLQLAYWVM
jgi:hypothetical protein